MPHSSPDSIRLLVLDVDGVLTDGRIIIDDEGRETKHFDVRDGAGLSAWRRLGYQTAIITGRSSMVVTHRARELRIGQVIQGCRDKRSALQTVLERSGVSAAQCAVMGDDLPDLGMMRACGYPIAVADACPEILAEAAHVTAARGGRGAVREAVEHLLRSTGRWGEAVALYAEVSDAGVEAT